jgi:hypothetical protein
MIRELEGTTKGDGAQIGLFLADEPTKEMRLGATTADEEHQKPILPLLILSTHQQAERIAAKKAAKQTELFGQ